MTVRLAKSPGRALRSLRHELDRLLPIDVLTSHYPDPSGRVVLNVALTRAMRSLIGQTATAQGQEPAAFLARTVVEAVARDEQTHTRQLTTRLQDLLAHHTPEAVLTCAARVLLDHQRPPSCSPVDADDQRPGAVHTTL
ncbi:hypothetical protein ACH40F_54525 [Streptomyces sp. NPDC020794]|uniref:hypothetical protein n=1 Tax=unclassified Streptomyces TaxID=2593676 RepID=UPI0036E399C7